MAPDPNGAVPHHPDHITPHWLTARLKESGALPAGAVASVAVRLVEQSNVAQSAHVVIEYDRGAPREAPRRLFAKISEFEDPLADIIAGEFAFYAKAPPENLPLAACYAAVQDHASGITCILLEDLSTTHMQSKWPLPPSVAMCEAAVASLARLHAHWWKGDVSGTSAFGRALREDQQRLARHCQLLVPDFLDNLNDRLAPERRALIRKICNRRFYLDRHSPAMTRMHGDAHLWNVMFPRDATRHGCVFVDWEDSRYGIAAADLAYMIALHWYPERRARHEAHLLRTYHEVLTSQLAIGYAWEDLMADYRIGHLQNLVVPIYQHVMGTPAHICWSHLERWFLAFEDLECGTLL